MASSTSLAEPSQSLLAALGSPWAESARENTPLVSCPTVPLRYALLFRGGFYNHGCTDHGIAIQDRAMDSHHQSIVRPLEACNCQVDVLLALDDRGCANSALKVRLASAFRSSQVLPTAALSYPPQRKQTQVTQALNARAAIDLYLPMAGRHDVLILTRYDLTLHRPILSWPACHGFNNKLGIASECQAPLFKYWGCVSDLLHVVPRRYLGVLNDSVGTITQNSTLSKSDDFHTRLWVNPSGCFAAHGLEKHSRGVPLGAGHGCYQNFASRMQRNQLEFCWPAPKWFKVENSKVRNGSNVLEWHWRPGRVSDPNEFYSCCKHHRPPPASNESSSPPD